jgi:opacity protein-like surface antigen
MKKAIFLTAIVISIAMPVTRSFAQDMDKVSLDGQKGFQIGIQGTPQFSWLMNSDDHGNSSFTNMTTVNSSFGVDAHYGFSEMHGIGLDVIYSMQGQRYKLSGTERYKQIDYVKIPLTYDYTMGISPNILFIGRIGPQLGFLSNAWIADKSGSHIGASQTNAYQSTDFGAVIGAGLGFKLAEKLYLDLVIRYDYGFTNAEDKNHNLGINNTETGSLGDASSGRASTYNSTLGLLIGLRYAVTK